MGIRNRIRGGAGAGRGDNPHDSGVDAGSSSMGGPPRPREIVKIDGGNAGASSNPVPDTRAARKANSPKAKAKALKEVNKNPLKKSSDNDPFASPSGFVPSQAASDFTSANSAEKRLAKGSDDDFDKKTVANYVSGKTQANTRRFNKD